MNNNFNKSVSKISFYGCWVAIVLISFVYILSSYAVSSSSVWPERILHEYGLPKIDPLVHIDNNEAIAPRPEYYSLKEQPQNFYSIVTNQSHSEVFYRPDFGQYPWETSLILLLRLATYIGIVLFFYFLSQVSKSVYQHNPFHPGIHSKLLYMGIIMLLLPIVRSLHSAVLADFLMESPRLIGWDILPSYLSLWFVLFGVTIIVLSYVFKELVRIHEEQKLTV